MKPFRCSSVVLALATLAILGTGRCGQAAPCLIFVHGKRTNTDTFTNWNAARSYWTSGSADFVKTATKNFAKPYYVIGYNGTKAYWDAEVAGEVAAEILNATNGGADGGGNHCTQTYAAGGTFWVIGHSMAGNVIDFIVGNSRASDPNFNFNGPYDEVTRRLSVAITVAGTHRGSQLADAVCGNGTILCTLAGFFSSCDTATYWIRTADDVQVRNFAGAPARNVYLTGGYAAIFGPSACLAGEDDGLVQHASQFACSGSATASYTNSTVCDNANKQKATGFFNLDVAHENHDEERNDSHRHTRQAIPTGIWTCGAGACAAGTTIQNARSAAQLVRMLY